MLLKRIIEYFSLWGMGGSIYYCFELIFRGYSHISMFILGGISMMFITFQGQASNWREPLWKQVVRCSIFVTAGEFITGIIVNKWMKLKVWDYSDQPFQLFGQICLPFAIIFSGLCTLGIVISGYFLHIFFREEIPKFRVL